MLQSLAGRMGSVGRDVVVPVVQLQKRRVSGRVSGGKNRSRWKSV